MEPEGSLPYTQQPATCPYPEPDQLSLRPTPNLSKVDFNIILPSMPGSTEVKNDWKYTFIPIRLYGMQRDKFSLFFCRRFCSMRRGGREVKPSNHLHLCHI
jgi:hypothetical protein